MVAISAPNTNKAEFYKKLEERLTEIEDQKIILIGDYNGVATPELDRLTKKKKVNQGKLPRSIF